MNRFPPSFDPQLYTISAVIIGLALIDNFTANEQNAIGNWFITIGQTLENNAAWQQVIEERVTGNTINVNSQNAKNGGSPYMNNKPLYPRPTHCSSHDDSQSQFYTNEEDYFDALEKTIKIMKDEIEKLKE